MPDEKSGLVEHMFTHHKVSHRQACKAVHLSSSTHRYQKKVGKDEPVVSQLQQLVESILPLAFGSATTVSAGWVGYGITSGFIGCIHS